MTIYSEQSTVVRGHRPIAVDLFAGAGGLSLGFEQAGFDIAAAVEIDPIHCAVHHYNFPNSHVICANVADLTGEDIRIRAGICHDIDVLCGGAPCQGFSLIGQRAMDDPRNQLVFHFVRLIQELQPKYFVFENVKGLTIGKHRKFLDEIVEEMTRIGYDVVLPWKVLNAADFGVPQNRHRLFLMGAKRGLPMPTYPKSEMRCTVREAIFDLPNADDFSELLQTDQTHVSFSTKSIYAKRLRGLLEDSTDFSYQRIFDASLLTCSGRTEHTELSKQRFLATENGATEVVSRFLKLHPDGLCNTLRAGTDSARGAFTSPRPIHPNFPRVITVREAARLHSYPDWFRFHCTKWHGFREIGNSVPPIFGRAIAQQIIQSLGVVPEHPLKKLRLSNEFLLQMNMASAAKYFQVSAGVIAQRVRKADLQPDDFGFQMKLCEPESVYG
jgi:DNA (cytosine-5)-methyltransferase 1